MYFFASCSPRLVGKRKSTSTNRQKILGQSQEKYVYVFCCSVFFCCAPFVSRGCGLQGLQNRFTLRGFTRIAQVQNLRTQLEEVEERSRGLQRKLRERDDAGGDSTRLLTVS